MRPPTFVRFCAAALLAWTAQLACAQRMLVSDSLQTCSANSSFSASLFKVALTPNNGSLSFNVVGDSTINGNVTIDLTIYAYGFKAYSKTINPCTEKSLSGLCPMVEGPLKINSNLDSISQKDLAQVPGIAYTVPDLDATVKVYFNSTTTGEAVACVEANLSNGKTVDQEAVAWVTAVISGLALVSSAVTSGLGHSNTAAHVAANALSLFGYFQAQAFIGMMAVPLPPIVASWTQNFQWSMGIIKVDFLQTLATWYQRSTGGTASQLLDTLSYTSVLVEKRGLEQGLKFTKRAIYSAAERMPAMMKRDTTTVAKEVVVKGIQRVGFRAGIEPTNIFLTGYIFFLIFIIFTTIGVLLFKGVCELLVKNGHLRGEKFQDFRNGWTTVLKGILFRIVLIGFPQMVVLCFWEFSEQDSPAEVVLAVFTIFTMLGLLGWASSKVIRLAQRSISMHKNPAYVLYSDPASLNKWGFLYVQFKATAYYFIVPVLLYILIKGIFVGTAQSSGNAQAVALLIIEAAYLIGVSVLRPYMDKKINGFNIAICSINFLSSIFVLVFSDIFNPPDIVTGVMGVIFFVYNAAFSTVLLVMVLVASVIAITTKNPDTRYQPMRDDRGSFIKTGTNLTTELDALGATARGESKHPFSSRIEDDDDASFSGESGANKDTSSMPHQPEQALYSDPPRSPMAGSGFPQPPTNTSNTTLHNPGYNRLDTASPVSRPGSRPGPGAAEYYAPQQRSQPPSSQQQLPRFRPQQGQGQGGGNGGGANPWQRGAGYD